MEYQGFCGKYGFDNMTYIGIYSAPVLTSVFYTATSAPISHVITATGASIIVGLMGLGAANQTHRLANKYLSNKHIGMTKGSKIVKASQVAAYLIAVGTIMSAIDFGLNYSDKQKNETFSAHDKISFFTPNKSP